jgi:hypothetical protein
LSACETYKPTEAYMEGFTVAPAGKEAFYYVGFRRNGFTQPEIIQAYWLYNCAVFTLSQGYDGFEVASASLVVTTPNPGDYPPPPFVAAGALPYLANDFFSKLVTGSALQDNIQLLKKPFTPNPPKIFDAETIKEAYGPYVAGKK